METLKYSSDHNNVLQLDCFPAVRMSKGKYRLDQRVVVECGKKKLGIAVCVRHQSIKFHSITDSLSFTICGKESAYLQAVLRNMYPRTNWLAERLDYMHFRFIERFQEAPLTEHVAKSLPVQTMLTLGARSHRAHQ